MLIFNVHFCSGAPSARFLLSVAANSLLSLFLSLSPGRSFLFRVIVDGVTLVER